MGLSHQELWRLLGLLAAMGVLLVLAPVTRVPYPIFLVVGGLVLGAHPRAPQP